MAVNKFIGIGRLCNDIELKTTPSGANVLNNTLAVNENYKDKQGQKIERTEFIRLVFWNRTAEIVSSYCRKGSQIYVEGSLQTREWEDKDGNKRYTTEIVVRNLQLLDSKQSSDNQGGGYAQSSQQNQPQNDIDEDHAPF
jgi:single-strand DNA-binding protein